MKILFVLFLVFLFFVNLLMEVIMYIFAKFHRFIFIIILALILTITVAVASDGTLLAERSCAYKGINCQCLLVEADDRFFIVAKRGDEIIAVYEIVVKETGSEVILLWEYGISI